MRATSYSSCLANTQMCSVQHNPITSLEHGMCVVAITIYDIKVWAVVNSKGLNNPSD